jgi:formylglycine-generating enzyme required for sulfatase activity
MHRWFLLFFFPTFIAAQTDFKAYEQTVQGTTSSIKMTPIPAGSFLMGSPESEKGREADEGTPRKINISAFYMSVYETTFDQYDFFQDEEKDGAPKPDAITRPSPPYIDFTLGMGKQGGFPANSMSQYGALMYCKWLYQKTGIFYRLPTEAEWEYACRADTATIEAKKIKEYGWFAQNSAEKYHKVGELKPNRWGLYDMLGNVMEWTLDEYREDYAKITTDTDPSVPRELGADRHPRTLKGGCFKDKATDLRPANRIKSDPVWNRRDPQIPKSKWWNADAPFIGFRIVRPFVQPTKEEIETFFKTHLE